MERELHRFFFVSGTRTYLRVLFCRGDLLSQTPERTTRTTSNRLKIKYIVIRAPYCCVCVYEKPILYGTNANLWLQVSCRTRTRRNRVTCGLSRENCCCLPAYMCNDQVVVRGSRRLFGYQVCYSVGRETNEAGRPGHT